MKLFVQLCIFICLFILYIVYIIFLVASRASCSILVGEILEFWSLDIIWCMFFSLFTKKEPVASHYSYTVSSGYAAFKKTKIKKIFQHLLIIDCFRSDERANQPAQPANVPLRNSHHTHTHDVDSSHRPPDLSSFVILVTAYAPCMRRMPGQAHA